MPAGSEPQGDALVPAHRDWEAANEAVQDPCRKPRGPGPFPQPAPRARRASLEFRRHSRQVSWRWGVGGGVRYAPVPGGGAVVPRPQASHDQAACLRVDPRFGSGGLLTGPPRAQAPGPEQRLPPPRPAARGNAPRGAADAARSDREACAADLGHPWLSRRLHLPPPQARRSDRCGRSPAGSAAADPGSPAADRS